VFIFIDLSTNEGLKTRLEIVDPFFVELRQLEHQQLVRLLEAVLGSKVSLFGFGSFGHVGSGFFQLVSFLVFRLKFETFAEIETEILNRFSK